MRFNIFLPILFVLLRFLSHHQQPTLINWPILTHTLTHAIGSFSHGEGMKMIWGRLAAFHPITADISGRRRRSECRSAAHYNAVQSTGSMRTHPRSHRHTYIPASAQAPNTSKQVVNFKQWMCQQSVKCSALRARRHDVRVHVLHSNPLTLLADNCSNVTSSCKLFISGQEKQPGFYFAVSNLLR